MRQMLLSAVLALISVTSNAGIIDTTNNSFIDTDTGLEWMDFGVNNSHTPQHVWDNIGTLYPGWRAASQAQVLLMWDNAFGGRGSDWDAQFDGLGYYSIYNDDTDADSVHEAVFDVMSYNSTTSDAYNAKGWFEDDDGFLSLVAYEDHHVGFDWVYAIGRGTEHTGFRTKEGDQWSTMLVRDVPEPATLAIMGLGLAGIGWRRRRKVKTKR